MEAEYSKYSRKPNNKYNYDSSNDIVMIDNIVDAVSHCRARPDSEDDAGMDTDMQAHGLEQPPAASTAAHHVADIDPLDLRFHILRQLLPRGSELQDKDDILSVVFQYVKDLEREIQNFNGGMGIATEGMGALQKKGLCIVQLSQFTKAF